MSSEQLGVGWATCCPRVFFRQPETFVKLNLKQKSVCYRVGQYNPPQRREKLITHCFLWIFRTIGLKKRVGNKLPTLRLLKHHTKKILSLRALTKLMRSNPLTMKNGNAKSIFRLPENDNAHT